MTDYAVVPIEPGRYRFSHVLHAEWLKLRSLRSTRRTLFATIAGSLLITVLATSGIHRQGPGSWAGFDSTNQSLTGLALGSMTVGVLAILMITGEYASGTIRSSLAATPRRPLLLAAKTAIIASLSLAVGEILTFVCFFLGRNILEGKAPVASISQHGVIPALVLSGASVSLLALFGLALGVIIRHSAGAISTFVGIVFVLPVALQPLATHGNPGRFAPLEILANSVSTVVRQSGQLSPTVGFLFLALYAVAALAIAMMCLIWRDA
jgi:hypothetical protein